MPTSPSTLMKESRKDFIIRHIRRIDAQDPTPMLSKHAKMGNNPFAFYRGTAQLFYADLQRNSLNLPSALDALPLTCITGDCHLSNFGFVTEEGSHGDSVIFTPNDFDDACVGFAHWDILRFLISLPLAAEFCNGIVGDRYSHPNNGSVKPVISDQQVAEGMSLFLKTYSETCASLIDNPQLRHSAIDQIPEDTKLHKLFRKAKSRAAGGTDFVTKSALAKAIYMAEDGLAFIPDTDKFSTLAPYYYREVEYAFAPFMDDKIIDIVSRNNAGTGSVNMARFYFLVGPAKPHNQESFSRCHIVEVKQQRAAAPLYYFNDLSPINRLNPAHLTARCQRKMERRPDLLLDEALWQSTHYLVRSRHHARVGVAPEDVAMGRKNVNGGFAAFTQLCAKALATAHARGDRRSDRFEQKICEILPAHVDALTDSAVLYARQVLEDYQLFTEALNSKGLDESNDVEK